VSSGVFKGQLAALFADSTTGIAITFADHPYQSWSAAQTVVTDAGNSSFSACMDSGGSIYLVYVNSNKDIKLLKLAFVAGQWNAGAPITVVNTDDNYAPFILKDSDGRLWCLFANHRVSSDSKYLVRTKSSLDDGQTWGTGPADLGTQLSAASIDMPYISAVQVYSNLFAVYSVDRSNLKFKACNLTSLTWGLEIPIYSVDFIDEDFDIAASTDGRLGIVMAPASNGKVYFKEFDGSAWSGVVEVEAVQSRSPQIVYQGKKPYIFYARHLGSEFYSLRCAVKSGESFAITDYPSAAGIFDKVFVFYNAGTSKFQDKTTAAASMATADVLHSESQAMLDSIDDCLYIGKESRFFCAAVTLSTIGIGGSVSWEYFNGTGWVAFTPSSGSYLFDSVSKLVILWQDADSVPSAWQLGAVNGVNAYWVRARVVSGFSTNPVGTQVLAAARCDDLVLVR
jgi:hypothetical protein